MFVVCSEMLFFFSCPCAILTDTLARTQLMELRGEAVEVGDPHTAEANAADRHS